jgi:tetratricopeptide (TPR) repeat protein
MSHDQTEYELFISYARLDNRPIPESYPHGWVSALAEQIIADHEAYETAPLRIFFDTHEIRDMDDWRNRILGALRRSKVLLICLSPNYFRSGPCRWEWDEYQARQHQTLIGSDSHATVYFVEVPGTDERDNARRLEAILSTNFTDLRPWFPAGAAALQEEAVRQRMAALGQGVWERIERARRALAVPGNVRGMTPYFVGRNRELADLHRLVGVGKIGLVTAVHGLGGQGKTELAVAYARGYADAYPLGLWSLAAESQAELLPLIGKLGFEPRFGYTPTEAEKNDTEQLGLGVLLELDRRAAAARANHPDRAPAALLILDNVSEPGLLAPTQVSKLPTVDWLRLIATTRLDPRAIDPARKQLGAVEVDSLDPDNALRLLVDHLPAGRFSSAQDEADAREIVRELGGFTLAVEQAAVFLGLNPDVSPGAYLAHLRASGLPSTDDLVDESVQGQIEHQTKLLGPIIASMLAPLGGAGRTLLTFAALLPPERIPWPWLKELTVRDHPELAEETLPNPWTRLRRQVQGLRLLTGSTEDQSARMHRLIAAHLRADADDERDAELRRYLAQRADDVYQQHTAPADWELDGILEAIPHLLNAQPDRQLAVDGMFLSDKVVAYRNLPMARSLLTATGVVIQALADADPTSAQNQRDLSISFTKLGDVSVAAGDLKAARGYFEDGLRISRLLADADPTSAQNQRDLSISFNKLGDVSVAAGDLKAARGYFEDGLRISRLLADADPTSAQNQRDLSISYERLGDVSVAAGDLKAARGYFEDALRISRRLADADPTSAQN